MTQPIAESIPATHRWYARPVFFVTDLNRALHFYVDLLGFAKAWHEAEGTGPVCQVHRSDCEIILCQSADRKDKSRLFVELTKEGWRSYDRRLQNAPFPMMKSGGAMTSSGLETQMVMNC